MVQADALREVADVVLDLGVPAMVGLEAERVAIPVGDEGVMVVEREEGPMPRSGPWARWLRSGARARLA